MSNERDEYNIRRQAARTVADGRSEVHPGVNDVIPKCDDKLNITIR